MEKDKEYVYKGHIPTRVIRERDLEDWSGAPLLNLAELNVTKVQRAIRESDLDPIDYLLYHCEPRNRTTQTCPRCGDANYSSGNNSEKRRRLVHDVTIGMTQIDLFLKSPRYKCKSCGFNFNHRFLCAMQGRHMTARLYDYICRQSFQKTFTELALEVGYSDSTIRDIFDEYCEQLKPHLPQIEAPRVLGIDEVTVLGKRRGVFVDAEGGTLLDIKKDNKD